jgi:hypothetical protein
VEEGASKSVLLIEVSRTAEEQKKLGYFKSTNKEKQKAEVILTIKVLLLLQVTAFQGLFKRNPYFYYFYVTELLLSK